MTTAPVIYLPILLSSILLWTSANADASNVKITHIEPREGSTGGATKLTIHGRDFASSEFNHGEGNENVGNKVDLVSLTRSYPCEIHKDGTTELQIMCITPPRMVEDDYYVKVKVDGESVPNENHCYYWRHPNCRLSVRQSYTPSITSIDPQSGPPDTTITVRGRLFSDRRGSHLAESSNGKTEKFLRIYVGGYECKLLEDPEDDKKFLVKLDNENSNNGFFTCTIASQYVYNQNVSYIVEGKYGRSRADPSILRVSGDETIYTFQSYAEITSVSPSSVSKAGGATLTITGKNFDETNSPARVTVGGEACDVISTTSNAITCTIPSEPASKTSYSGNRGVDFEVWSSPGVSDIEDVLDLAQSPDSNHTEDFKGTIPAGMTTRCRTVFVAPSNNSYQFMIASSSATSKLYLSDNSTEKTEIASSSSRVSDIQNLQKGSSYFLDFVGQASSDSSVQVGVCALNTRFTSGMTGAAKSEKQRIAVRSTIKKEIQTLTLTDFTPVSGRAEVQRVDVLGSASELDGATYRLGINGVYTVPLLGDADASTVQEALLALPGSLADSVTVTQSSISGGNRYTVTFAAGLGDVGAMTTKTAPNVRGETLTITVQETTKGMPSREYFSLEVDGIFSAPIPPDASNSQMKTAVSDMFMELCPSAVENPSRSAYFESYEALTHSRVLKMDEPEEGTIIRAFCGKSFWKNPSYLYQAGESGIYLGQYKTVCFAYLGGIQSRLYLHYTYKDSGSEERSSGRWFDVQDIEATDSWRYVCVDMMALISQVVTGGSRFFLNRVVIARQPDENVYIDSVYIGVVETTTDFTGLNEGWTKRRQALPSGHMINDVTVTSSGSAYTVELTPNECGNNFHVFKVKDGQVTSGSSSQSSLSAEYSYGGGTISVSVDEEASPPVTGQFDLTFNGKTKSVPVKSTAEDLQAILQSIGAIGSIVSRGDNCANFDWIVTWTGKGGDQSELEITSQSLSGIDASIAVTTLQNGMLCYDPIPAEFLRTVHDTPQVSAYINGIPTACEGSCDLEWADSATPTVTSVAPTSGTESLGTTVTISGTKFSTTPSDNTVMIGGTNCTVQSATTTSITCDVGNGQKGSYQVEVTVSGLGLATHPENASVMFTYVADVDSISPTTGSTEGGADLQITGYGFTSGAVVTVGGENCHVTFNTPALIRCVTPKSTTRADSTVDVVVTQDGNTLTSKSFTYSTSATASITSVTPTMSAVQGGVEITISGSGFGSDPLNDDALMIGDAPANITHYSDTEVRGELPGHAPGSYPVRLKTGAGGYADTREHSIGEISYILEVTNLYPKRGSLFGGTVITITGRGFSTVGKENDVMIGDHACAVESSTDVEIICTIEDISTLHTITNKGQSPVYGTGFAWDHSTITVQVGDTVRWEWTSDPTLGLKYRVQRTDSLAATEYDGVGFNSGSTGTASGVYQYQFTETGVNSYWSGYVTDESMITLRGEVQVIPRTSHVAYLKVSRGNYEAEYKTASGVADPSGGACPGVTSAISGCSVTEPTSADSSQFGFAFWECSTPEVSQITPVQGTGEDDIVITGSGFGTTDCQNIVTLGGHPTDVTGSSAGQVTVRLDPSEEVPAGKVLPVKVRVGNLGNALIKPLKETDRSFVALPYISGLNPGSGSMAGGTNVNITGGGFSVDASVSVDGYACDITSLTYGTIACTTGASTGSAIVVVKSRVDNGQLLDAECKDSGTSCVFMYTSQATPTLTSTSPAQVDTPTAELTLTGSGFGTDMTKITVALGTGSCVPSSVTDTQIVCNMQNVPAGTHSVLVTVEGKGLAQAIDVTLENQAKLTGISPSSGSIHGGTRLTITGNGFTDNVTTILVGTAACDTESITPDQIVCVTSAHADGSVDLLVTSGNLVFSPTQSFSYSSAETPTITSVTPSDAPAGSTITIAGTGFTGNTTVTIDSVECTVTSTSPLQCTLGAHSAGSYPVHAHVVGVGNSNADQNFKYSIEVTSISPNTGSFAGGQEVTVSGAGFDPETSTISICNETCALMAGAVQTSSALKCLSPSYLYGDTSQKVCNVTVTVNNVEDVLANGFTFDPSLTPDITSVTPGRGGTAGGTSVTISGQGFSNTMSDNSVTIGGVACAVTAATTTELICTTGASEGTIETTVRVTVLNKGDAIQTSAAFHYVDVWSSIYTWGGQSPPVAGDVVVIQKGQTILLDTDTPVLKLILIQGGKLVFDETNVELQVEIILITDGGVLQVGTEDEPFQHKAIITLHGHLRSRELPIYGTKCIAVREGVIDLHGKPVPKTWTRLASTANAGQNSITLADAVDWSVGDYIVIATTGDRHSQEENEKHEIASISADKRTLTLTSALGYTHLGVSETFDGQQVEFRAEVGLLTRNVVVRGSDNKEWHDKIEKCEAGFDTGEFSTQTCFQGRFGDEMGSDEFGGHIIMHGAEPDKHLVVGRLEYVEMTYVGQAFRLGRYPVHFHLNGDMSGSYVRGLGIHKTFNRAVNIHGTHNVLVEHTVIFNIRGGAFFLEDGVETGNIFMYNLAVFVISSTSLLNDDITPAAFWATNANNTYIGNTAVGGTHFGFWYRMHEHPDGPSFDPNICPKKVPLGVFRDNIVHSQGWFGIWIFEDFFPMVGGGCSSNTPTKAVFEDTTVWNCEKGIEFVNGGSLQFDGGVLVNNEKAGFEGKKVMNAEEFSEDGPMLKNTVIAAHATNLPTYKGPTRGGIVLPYGQGYTVANVTFVNFDQSGTAAVRFTRIDGTCGFLCGGFTYHFNGIKKNNSPKMGFFEWINEGVIIDEDGTLSGVSGGRIVSTLNTLPPSKCQNLPSFGEGLPASVCQPDVHFIRFSFNGITPVALKYKDANFTNSYGTDAARFAEKRITHKDGWQTTLVAGETYTIVFDDAEIAENISYSSRFDFHEPSDFVVLSQRLQYLPDRFSFSPGNFINASNTASLSSPANSHGDWIFDSNQNLIRYMVSAQGSSSTGITYKFVNLEAYRCYYVNCEPPPDPNSVPPTNRRPDDAVMWSNVETWKDTPAGWGGNYGNGSYGLPQNDDDVVIPEGMWVVADVALPRMKKLYLYGVLEIDGDFDSTVGGYKDFVLSAEYIYIVGGRLIAGWPDSPFKGNVDIILRGTYASPRLDVLGGPEVGAKAIGVFGGLDLHGKDVTTPWTTLGATADVGATSLTLSETVDWEVGNQIVVAPTGYDPWETETFTITSVSGAVIGLNDSVQYKHVAFSETVDSQSYSVTAEVGLLTRNVKVIGEDYDKLFDESFGARILVGLAADADKSYLGYARIANVEFVHTGQEGFRDAYDPRFSVSYLDCGTVSPVRPSYVRKSAFHNGFSTAIGVYSTNNLEITDNIIHHTVGTSIEVMGDSVMLRNNLVTLSVFPGTYQDRLETMNVDYMGAIDARKATNLKMIGNAVSGSERIAYRVPGESCDVPGEWTGNVARTSLMGIGLLPDDGIPGCLKFSKFAISRCMDFGVYINTESSMILSELTLVGNILGVFPMVFGPSPLAHQSANKFVIIEDSLVVGTGPSFDCSANVLPTEPYYKDFTNGRSNFLGDGGKIGIVWASFTGASNSAPTMSFTGITDYPALLGKMTVSNVTFGHFANTCGRKDVAITTNPRNDDGMHPVEADNLKFVSTPENNKVFIHRPNVGKVNPSDCVDMDCDGLKKAILVDTDGSLLGSPGTVLSQSEFEWDGDRRRGLGDYRIPKTLLTASDGSRIAVDDIAPNKGIFRTSSCQAVPEWQAHRCPTTDYRMLIIESMDSDTETRRLSPVAVLVDDYIDLINGPQDHGWCAGYTCQKRLSTFMAVVPTGKEASIYFTSTSPQSLRFHLLNSASNDAVLLAIWYAEPYRLDVYYQDNHVLPTNGYLDSNGNYQLRKVTSVDDAKPEMTDPSGTNFMDRENFLMYVLVKGSNPVLIKTHPVIVVVFETSAEFLTVDQFFGENLVNNLVAFLGVDPSKVRLVNVVNENSVGRRKRQASGNVKFYLEIGDDPPSSVNATVGGSLNEEQLKNYTVTLVNAAVLGTLNLNASMYVIEPLPSPSDPSWSSRVVSNQTSPPSLVLIEPIDRIAFETEPTPMHEGKPFSAQPKLKALSLLGSRVRHLGTTYSPWKMKVTLKMTSGSYIGASLNGNTSIEFNDGWAEFSDIAVSHAGTYILEFAVTSPPEATNFTLERTIVVAKRPLTANVVSMSGVAVENSPVIVVLDLRDEMTSEKIEDLSWRGHTWSVSVSLPNPNLYWGKMAGSASASFNPATGEATFSDLSFSHLGEYMVHFRVTSNPPEYDFYILGKVTVIAPHQANIIRSQNTTVEMRFDVNYNDVIGSADDLDYFTAYVGNYFRHKYQDVFIEETRVRQGSIIVTFTVSGNGSDVTAVVYAACAEIGNQTTSFNFKGQQLSLSGYFKVDGSHYYGNKCGPQRIAADNSLHPGIIAAIVVICFMAVALIGILIFWKLSILPKTKTVDDDCIKHIGSGPVDTILFRENTFESLRERGFPHSPVAPSDTRPPSSRPSTRDSRP